jgi:uncharacterized integral membrane protein (TIGR00698 family)
MSQPDYSWAEYLDCMEGGASDVLSLPAAKPVAKAPAQAKDQPTWGVLLAIGVTALAFVLSSMPFAPFTLSGGRHPIEPVMMAIILGMILSNAWSLPKALQPGLKFSVKKLLPLGIVLLGARLNFNEMLKVGADGLLLSVIETVVALLLLFLLTRVLRLPPKLGVLLGIGTAICGGTAIVAAAPVIEAEEKDVAFSVATVTLLGLIAMFALPFIGHFLALNSKQFGVWAGLAIHQTPQVVAAGFAYSNEAGQTATIVKLARVCLLAPVVFLVGLVYARHKLKSTGVKEQKNINYAHLFPMFVLGFLAMALLKTGGFLPDLTLHVQKGWFLSAGERNLSLAGSFEQISKILITISMAGVGLETKFAAMRQTGLKPFVASLVAVVVVAVLVLALIKALGIGVPLAS